MTYHTLVASEELVEAARAWVTKLSLKKESGYPPDSYPNPGIWYLHPLQTVHEVTNYPALAFHNAQLEASAFREEFDEETFEDLTVPKIDMIHKVCSHRPLSRYIR